MACILKNKENGLKKSAKDVYKKQLDKPILEVQKRRPLRPRENLIEVKSNRFDAYKKEEADVTKKNLLNEQKRTVQVKKPPLRNYLHASHIINNNGKATKTTCTTLHLSQRKYKLSSKKINLKKFRHISKENSDINKIIVTNVHKNHSSSSTYTTLSSDEQEDNYADALSNVSKASDVAKIQDVANQLSTHANINIPEENQDGRSSPLKGFSSLSLKEILYDVDSQDVKDELCVAAYALDIYDYMFYLEKQIDLKESYMASPNINFNMRLILVDWIMQIHSHFKLLPETLYLTVNLIDRYLQRVSTIHRKNLQLVGVSAMFIACKFEELYIMEVKDFVYVTKDTYSVQEILAMEIEILKCIDFNFCVPYPLHFLRRFTKIAQVSFEEHTLSKFLIEMTLLDPTMLGHRPSIIAAGALCLSMKVFGSLEESVISEVGIEALNSGGEYIDVLGKSLKGENVAEGPNIGAHNSSGLLTERLRNKVSWNKSLNYHSRYTEEDLYPVMKYYIKAFQKYSPTSNYKTLVAKYSSSKMGNVVAIFKEYCSMG